MLVSSRVKIILSIMFDINYNLLSSFSMFVFSSDAFRVLNVDISFMIMVLHVCVIQS